MALRIPFHAVKHSAASHVSRFGSGSAMKSTCLLLTLALVTATSPADGNAPMDGVQVEMSLLQKLTQESEAVAVAIDTIVVTEDVPTKARLGNAVFDIGLVSASENTVTLRIEMITSGPSTRRFFETYTIPFGLPAIADSVIEKGESFYRATLRPLGIVDVEVECEYDMLDSTSYSSDPAPHFQIYFVPQSLGDYHWNAVRGYLELETENLDQLYKFDDSQPISLYLMPCYAKSLRYDQRHEFMIDPVRNSVMAIYNHEEKAAVSFASTMMKFYRSWGYAPLFFVEGIASSGDFNDYYVQEYLKEVELPAIPDYFISDSYARYSDQLMLRRIAGSFCTYLANSYDIAGFRRLYTVSTDLTAGSDLEEVYGKSLDSLIAEWTYYLDTLAIDPKWFRYHAQRVSFLRDYREAVALLEEGAARSSGERGEALELGNYHYRLGDYADALRYFGMQLEGDSTKARDIVTYANMLLINGLIDSAYATYERSVAIDSTQGMAFYKLGRILQHRGDLPRALEYLHMASGISDDDQIVIDAHLAIGQCLYELGARDSSEVYFASALNRAKLHMMGGDPNPVAAMRAGEAFVHLGQPETAIEHLEFARFTEERPFYLGRIALALGQAYDLMENRQEALEYYRLVRELPGAYLQCEAADRYVEQPFTLNR